MAIPSGKELEKSETGIAAKNHLLGNLCGECHYFYDTELDKVYCDLHYRETQFRYTCDDWREYESGYYGQIPPSKPGM